MPCLREKVKVFNFIYIADLKQPYVAQSAYEHCIVSLDYNKNTRIKLNLTDIKSR